jgi:hypothetical protein
MEHGPGAPCDFGQSIGPIPLTAWQSIADLRAYLRRSEESRTSSSCWPITIAALKLARVAASDGTAILEEYLRAIVFDRRLAPRILQARVHRNNGVLKIHHSLLTTVVLHERPAPGRQEGPRRLVCE